MKKGTVLLLFTLILLTRNYKIFLQRKGRWHDEIVHWGIFERKEE